MNLGELEIMKNKHIEYFNELRESLRYKVYLDLKNKGYYITPGLKYGADFLLYNDDPLSVHSQYLVLIKNYEEKINRTEIISLERISVSTKKKYILATCKQEDNIVSYKNLEWVDI